MAKLCVVVSGLVALAPPAKADDSAIVLLRRVDKDVMHKGEQVLAHHPLLRFRKGTGADGLQDVDLNGETIRFTLPAGGGRPKVSHPESYVPVGPDLSTRLPVDAAFRNGAGNSSVLAGRVLLNGGVVSPIELTAILDLGKVSRQLTATLRGGTVLGGKPEPLAKPRPIANGFLFERPLADGEVPAIQIDGGKSVSLVPAPAAELGFLAKDGGDIYVVWVVNTARHADGTPVQKNAVAQAAKDAPQAGAAGQGAGAAGQAPDGTLAEQGFDPDFDLLYDFVTGAEKRVIPLVSDPQTPPGDPPGHCMPGLTA